MAIDIIKTKTGDIQIITSDLPDIDDDEMEDWSGL